MDQLERITVKCISLYENLDSYSNKIIREKLDKIIRDLNDFRKENRQNIKRIKAKTMKAYEHAGKKLRIKKGAGKSVTGELLDGKEFVAEDYWINISGKTLWLCDGNPACLEYAIRTCDYRHIPIDDKVIYGKVGGYGHLFHESELEVISNENS